MLFVAINNKIFATPNVQPDFIITEEKIRNAVPTKAAVIFDKKTEHDINVMEKRHFEKTYETEESSYRVAKLESYLLGRTWEYTTLSSRMRTLRLASQRKMLSGTSLPPSIARYASPAKIANDSTPIYDNEDNVGLIDGFMKLYAPELYYKWSRRKKHIQECYNDG